MQTPLRYSLHLVLVATMAAWLGSPQISPAQEPPGEEQSPIDFRPDEVVSVKLLPPLLFHTAPRVTLDLFNNGETVRANVPGGPSRLLVGRKIYNLLQLHFHTPSEHTLNGESFPLEMHLVHEDANGKLLVIGVWIVLGREHKELQKIFRDLPQEEGEHRDVPHFDLRRLIPLHRPSFRYLGSLTTPPFTEGVQWIVLAHPIEMSAAQIMSFVDLFPEGIARETQPLNGRRVVTDYQHF